MSDGATEMPDAITSITPAIDRRLAEVLDHERIRWAAVDPVLEEPFNALAELVLVGGKRLRPAFFHWAHVGTGGDPADPVATSTGAAIEMLHAFALAHDDVMDRSDSRRGLPSIWRRFADLHHASGWQGDAERFGDAVAILVGDLAHVASDHLIGERSAEVGRIWDELRIEVNIGQYLDVLAGARGRTDEATARRILEYKTGRYSVQRPLHLGAARAGKFEEFEAAFTAYGQPVGVAFQLRDDILGAFGDESLTGKPVGDDLREAKPTPLLATAFDRASPAQADTLAQAGGADLDEATLAAMQQVIVETGAAAAIETEIADLTGRAVAQLDKMTLAGEAKQALHDLAHFVAFRTH